MNRKGIIRIIEVSIAILLIGGVVLTLAANKKIRYEKDLSEVLPAYLEEVAKDFKLREQIVATDLQDPAQVTATEGNITEFLKERITNPNYNFSIELCFPMEQCAIEPYPEQASGNMYVAERIISSALTTEWETKKIKIYLWRVRQGL